MKQEIVKYLGSFSLPYESDAETIAHDVLLNPRYKGIELSAAKGLALNMIKSHRRRLDKETSLHSESETDDLALINTVPYDELNERKAVLQANQRQLITQLADGSDERTTLIVQTFLDSDKPTVTNVAKRLGLDHKQVSRALVKLANNYSESKFGQLSDYLYA